MPLHVPYQRVSEPFSHVTDNVPICPILHAVDWHLTLLVPIGTNAGMSYHDRLNAVEAYAGDAGLSLATVCGRATGNARLFGRLKRRVEVAEADLAKIEEYIANNPIRGKRGDAPTAVQVGGGE